jgi:hypothetical protein
MPSGRPDAGPDWTARYQGALELTHEDEPLVPGSHTDAGIDAPPERDNQFGSSTSASSWRGWIPYAGLDGTDRRLFREGSPDRAWPSLLAAARRARERDARPDRACIDCGAVIPRTARVDKVRCDRCQVALRRANRRTKMPGPGQGARTNLPTSRTVYASPPKGVGNNDLPAPSEARHMFEHDLLPNPTTTQARTLPRLPLSGPGGLGNGGAGSPGAAVLARAAQEEAGPVA